MKRITLLFLFFLLLLSCQKQPLNITPDFYLSAEETENFKYDIIRYTVKMPKKATSETKFSEEFDEQYKQKAQNSDLIFYYVNPDNTNESFFALTYIVPSLYGKKVAAVGRVVKDDTGNIVEYEEVFRTWKMEEEELREKTRLLFEKYLQGKDLSPYYTKNSKGEFYIEFPDDNTSFDIKTKQWISSNPIPIE